VANKRSWDLGSKKPFEDKADEPKCEGQRLGGKESTKKWRREEKEDMRRQEKKTCKNQEQASTVMEPAGETIEARAVENMGTATST